MSFFCSHGTSSLSTACSLMLIGYQPTGVAKKKKKKDGRRGGGVNKGMGSEGKSRSRYEGIGRWREGGKEEVESNNSGVGCARRRAEESTEFGAGSVQVGDEVACGWVVFLRAVPNNPRTLLLRDARWGGDKRAEEQLCRGAPPAPPSSLTSAGRQESAPSTSRIRTVFMTQTHHPWVPPHSAALTVSSAAARAARRNGVTASTIHFELWTPVMVSGVDAPSALLPPIIIPSPPNPVLTPHPTAVVQAPRSLSESAISVSSMTPHHGSVAPPPSSLSNNSGTCGENSQHPVVTVSASTAPPASIPVSPTQHTPRPPGAHFTLIHEQDQIEVLLPQYQEGDPEYRPHRMRSLGQQIRGFLSAFKSGTLSLKFGPYPVDRNPRTACSEVFPIGALLMMYLPAPVPQSVTYLTVHSANYHRSTKDRRDLNKRLSFLVVGMADVRGPLPPELCRCIVHLHTADGTPEGEYSSYWIANSLHIRLSDAHARRWSRTWPQEMGPLP
ncbi:hypothetical protein C8J57DRAFT_1223722 [Mycena rebaudengoi]|nr:hypothetical protein C8J57DRAFT_1223722 [Mycena rebaudengoi]